MAILQTLAGTAKRILNFDAPYATLVDTADSTGEQQRMRHFSRLYDYYIGDEDDIKTHLTNAMLRTFKPSTIRRMQLPYYNIVRRIIDRLALAYKVPPDRYIVVSHEKQGEETVANAKEQKDHENYQELLSGSNINSQAKSWHKLARLGDTVLVHPCWREDHMEFDIFFPHQAVVLVDEDNYLEAKAVLYDYQTTEDGEEQFRRVYWDDEYHFVLDKENRVVGPEDNPDHVNPYGMLPFIPLRLRETENFWGEGDTQLVDIGEKINVLLVSTVHNAIMQSHGQLVALNTGLKGEIAVGPDTIIQAEQGSSEQTPSVSYINPNPATDKAIQLIDWMVKTAAMMRGLSANSLSLEANAQSGAAKAIDNFELMEIREDDVEILRSFEKRLFEVTRAIWNEHCDAGKQISDTAVFGIDFVKPEIQLTPKEDYEIKAIKLKLGLWTPDMDEVDEDEGIDVETARQVVRDRLAFRNELNDQFGIFQNLKLLDEGNGANDQSGLETGNSGE